MGKDVVLLDLGRSPFAASVRIALAEKGIEYESKEEDLSNKSPLLLQMNPVHKKVPVLIHNDRPISESLVILEYIDEVWAHNSPLLPSDPYDRARARFWADYVMKKIYTTGRKLWTTKGEEKEAAAKEVVECLKVLEGEVGDKMYFGGDMFGLVDVLLISFYSIFYAFNKLGNLSIETECPKLILWAERCIERETVSKNMPDKYELYDVLLALRNKFVAE